MRLIFGLHVCRPYQSRSLARSSRELAREAATTGDQVRIDRWANRSRCRLSTSPPLSEIVYAHQRQQAKQQPVTVTGAALPLANGVDVGGGGRRLCLRRDARLALPEAKTTRSRPPQYGSVATRPAPSPHVAARWHRRRPARGRSRRLCTCNVVVLVVDTIISVSQPVAATAQRRGPHVGECSPKIEPAAGGLSPRRGDSHVYGLTMLFTAVIASIAGWHWVVSPNDRIGPTYAGVGAACVCR